ncbi:hypothetical protein THAOC_26024, partial [Thalassiosira oceanica]
MCVGRGDQRSSDIESPRLDGVRKIRRHGLKAPESGELSPPTRVGKDGFLLYRLAVGTILAVKVSFLYGRRHNQEKKGPMGSWHDIPAGFEVCQAAQTDPKISAQKQGVAMEVEVDVGSQVVFPLSLGISKIGRCMGAS